MTIDRETPSVDTILRESATTWRETKAPAGIRKNIERANRPVPNTQGRLWWALSAGLAATMLVTFAVMISPESQHDRPIRLKMVSTQSLRAPSTARLRSPGTLVSPSIPSAPARPRRLPDDDQDSKRPALLESDDVA